jgi:hypothetical protein
MLFLNNAHVCSATTMHTFHGALDCPNPNLKPQSLDEFLKTFYSFIHPPPFINEIVTIMLQLIPFFARKGHPNHENK